MGGEKGVEGEELFGGGDVDWFWFGIEDRIGNRRFF